MEEPIELHDMYVLIYRKNDIYYVKIGKSVDNWISTYYKHIVKSDKYIGLIKHFYISESTERISIYISLLINELKLCGFETNVFSSDTVICNKNKFSKKKKLMKFIVKLIIRTKPSICRSIGNFMKNKEIFEKNHKILYRTAISCDMSKYLEESKKRQRDEESVIITRTGMVLKNGSIEIKKFKDTLEMRSDHSNQIWHHNYDIVMDHMEEHNKNIQRCDNEEAYRWVLSNIPKYMEATMEFDKMELFQKLYEKRELLKPKFLQKSEYTHFK
jgi:hypothetical protein